VVEALLFNPIATLVIAVCLVMGSCKGAAYFWLWWTARDVRRETPSWMR